MKETRKLSVIYFMISMVLLSMVCFGTSRREVEYLHTYNGCDVFYVETDNPEDAVKVGDKLTHLSDNFVLQSDFGIIEVENGEIVYNNIK